LGSIFLLRVAHARENLPVDLLRPPAIVPAARSVLGPLLPGAYTPEAWEGRRAELQGEWTRILGGFPQTKVALAPDSGVREELASFTRQRVTYQIEEGVRTDAMLLIPKGAAGARPGIVLFHPTYDGHYARVAGMESGAEPERQQAVQLVEHGYVVLCPRCFLWDEFPGETPAKTGTALYLANVNRMQERHPGWTGLTRMTWDGIRAIDFIQTLPAVDPQCIGIFGHSLGAKEVLYVAAFDERVKCIVSSEGGIGLSFSNWEDGWYLGPQITAAGFGREHHELLALIAPRPFLLPAGESADGDRSWPYLEAALPAYRWSGKPTYLAWFNHGAGHRYPPEAPRVAEAFLDRALK
jgi:dienelactone hydrolase